MEYRIVIVEDDFSHARNIERTLGAQTTIACSTQHLNPCRPPWEGPEPSFEEFIEQIHEALGTDGMGILLLDDDFGRRGSMGRAIANRFPEAKVIGISSMDQDYAKYQFNEKSYLGVERTQEYFLSVVATAISGE